MQNCSTDDLEARGQVLFNTSIIILKACCFCTSLYLSAELLQFSNVMYQHAISVNTHQEDTRIGRQQCRTHRCMHEQDHNMVIFHTTHRSTKDFFYLVAKVLCTMQQQLYHHVHHKGDNQSNVDSKLRQNNFECVEYNVCLMVKILALLFRHLEILKFLFHLRCLFLRLQSEGLALPFHTQL